MLRPVTASTQTKTIHEFLADAPDVDRSELWAALWGILSEAKDEITAELDVEPHPSGAGLEYWTSEDGGYEGSLNPYVGDPDTGAEWLVHSWIGNRKASILDMNLQVWLGPHIDVPHLVIVFGTVPNVFHFSDLVAAPRPDGRRRLPHSATSSPRTPSGWRCAATTGSPGRSATAPTCGPSTPRWPTPTWRSATDDEAVEVLRQRVRQPGPTPGCGWVREAQPVPVEEREALRRRDHLVRTLRLHAGPDERAVEEVPRRRAGRRAGLGARRPRPDRGDGGRGGQR